MGGSAPSAPDPMKTANAQFQMGMGASNASAVANNPNVTGPYGSSKFTVDGYEEIVGPDGNKIKVPRYNQNISLGQAEQGQKEGRDALISQLMGRASDSAGQSVTAGATPWQKQTSLGFMGSSAPDTRQLQESYAPADGFSADRAKVEEAMMSRGNELLGQNRDSEMARYAAMGLAPGGEKWGRASDQFERSGNDLAMQAILAGGQEQSRMLGEARSAGDFTNTARMNEFGMDMSRFGAGQGQIANENQRLAGDAAANNNLRMAQIAEMMGISNNDLQRLISSMSGVQPNSPQMPGFQGQAIGTPDYTGLVNNQYQSQVGSYNNRMTGLAGLAKTALGFLPIPGAGAVAGAI